MKKFILKTSVFILPFAFMIGLTHHFYKPKLSGDLLRLGYVPNFYERYTKMLSKQNEKEIHYEYLSKTPSTKKFKILTVGDSFSEEKRSYNNFLAKNHTMLNIHRLVMNDDDKAPNIIQKLYALANGDFFSTYQIDYVIFQRVERLLLKGDIQTLDTLKKVDIADIAPTIEDRKEAKKASLFSRDPLFFTYYFLLYLSGKDYLANGRTHNVKLHSNSLFSNGSDRLLFYYADLDGTKLNNEEPNIRNLNNILNDLTEKLASKNVKLIVLSVVDKYDFYYEYIKNKANFRKPLFFEHLEPLPKKYIYVNSKKILSAHINDKKDIYFWGDSHWSAVGSKIISAEIEKIIDETDNKVLKN